MTKTKAEIVAEAHRRIQVLSVDDDPSDDMVTYGESAADSLFAELNADPFNMGFTWTLDTTPEAAFRPFAWLLAVDLAAHYMVQPRDSRARAVQRLAAYAFPDDREDERDTDEDGTISEAEENAGKRAAYY